VNDIEIIRGYVPGLVGRVTELHAKYYSEHWGFGSFFEAKVATEMSDFVRNYNKEKDCIFSATFNNTIEASITIDRTSEIEDIAHLRWFLVSDALRGKGAGNKLMCEALSFSRANSYKRVYLWTFKGLLPAKHLYEKHGFVLNEEIEGKQWGSVVTEQRYSVEL